MLRLRLFAGGLLALFLAPLALGAPAHAQRARAGSEWGPTISGTVSFAEAESEAWIPFTRSPAGLVLLRGTVNGAPVLALIDTGAPYTAIDTAFARKNGVKLALTVGARSGQINVFNGPIDSMRIGPITQTGGRLAAIDLSSMADLMKVPLTMVLGADYLRNVAVEFDFDNSRLRIRKSGVKGPDGVSVPLGVITAANRFVISMKVGDVAINRVLIDTGINATLTVTTTVWKRLPLAGVRVTSSQAQSLYGPEIWPLARFEGVSIGPAAIPGKIDVLADPDGILNAPVDGMIGMEALRAFNIFFDAKAGRMTLSPRVYPHRFPAPGTLGILGYRVPEGFSGQHIMKGSPAALAGMKDGDVVCSVNGQSIARGQPGAYENWAAKPVGTTLVLGLCSGKTISVTLKEFY
jgi:predicted aspartyl protease